MPQTTGRKEPGQHLIRRLSTALAVAAVLGFALGFWTAMT